MKWRKKSTGLSVWLWQLCRWYTTLLWWKRSTQITSHRFPITCCHECWIDTEVMRLQMQVSKVSFQSLIIHIERNQLVWLWCLTRMPPGNLSLEVFLAHLTWRESRVETEHTKEIKQYMSSGLGRHPDPPEEVEGRAMSGLPCLTCYHSGTALSKWMDGWINGQTCFSLGHFQ